jgi:hypothetical protein
VPSPATPDRRDGAEAAEALVHQEAEGVSSSWMVPPATSQLEPAAASEGVLDNLAGPGFALHDGSRGEADGAGDVSW